MSLTWSQPHEDRFSRDMAQMLFSELPIQEPEVSLNAVYANNEVSLEDIEVYGFDYDYTLATYKPDLHHLLFNLGRDALVTKHKVIII